MLETTLWVLIYRFLELSCSHLNPYYTGSYSMSYPNLQKRVAEYCLNPYYIGSYSMRSLSAYHGQDADEVLILIILEVTLWDLVVTNVIDNGDRVLILIILEVTLWAYHGQDADEVVRQRLNPYYIGSYSMRWIENNLSNFPLQS